MEKEIEAKFFIANKDIIRKKIEELGLTLVKKETLMRRKTFHSKDSNGWMRVRDEGDKIIMTYKEITGSAINDVNEIEINVSDFDKASELINQTSFKESSYQENYREVWKNDEVEIVIDTWPYLPTYIEIEAKSEELVKKYSLNLGLNYFKSYFGSVDVLYKEIYGIPTEDFIKLKTVTFDNTELKMCLESYK